MASPQDNPVSKLNEFYQRLHRPLPRYEFIDLPSDEAPNEPRFICNVYMDGVTASGAVGFEASQFQGEGRNKRDAKNYAAREALSFLQDQPICTSTKPYEESLLATVAKVLGDEGLGRDPEMRAYVLYAQQHLDGCVPLSAITHSRLLRGWFKEHQPEVSQDHAAMMKAIRQQISKEGSSDGSTQGVHITADGLGVCRTKPYKLPNGVQRPIEHQVETAEPYVVRVPAALSQGIEEVQMHAGGDLLSKLSALLSTDPHHLVIWGKVGHKVFYVAPPEISQVGIATPDQVKSADFGPAEGVTANRSGSGEGSVMDRQGSVQEPPTKKTARGNGYPIPQAAQLPLARAGTGPSLSVQSLRVAAGPAAMDWLGSSEGAEQEEVRGPAAAAPAGADEDADLDQVQDLARTLDIDPSADAHDRHVIRMAHPSLYSVYLEDEHAGGEAELNLRASWLAGHPVKGDAMFTLCRLTPNEYGHHAVKWRSFSSVDFWRSVTAQFPCASYSRAAHSPLLCKLPVKFSDPANWFGPLPKLLLKSYCEQHAWHCGQASYDCTPALSHDTVMPPSESSRESQDAAGMSQTADAGAVSHTADDDVTDLSQGVTCTVTVVPFGRDQPVQVTSGVRPTQMHAEQEAALRMLHLLEHSDVQLLQGSADNAQQDSNPLAPSVHETLQPSITGSHTPDHPGHMAGGDQESVLDDHGGVHVLYGGHDNHPEPAPGKMAKVNARLFIPAAMSGTGNDYVLEQRAGITFEIGSGGVLPELEQCVLKLKVNGTAKCRVRVPLEGVDPLHKFKHCDATLAVKLLSISQPSYSAAATAGQGGVGLLFDPPLSVTRYGLVDQVAREVRAGTIMDIGCGEGRLIDFLVRNAAFTSIQSITGVDISADALNSAGRRLEKLLVDCPSIIEDKKAAAGTAGDKRIEREGSTEDTFQQDSSVWATAPSLNRQLSMTDATPSAPPSPTHTSASAISVTPAPIVTPNTSTWFADVSLVQGNIASPVLTRPEGWGPYSGAVDLAALVEVIEHLEPQQLAMVGPSVLGGLRPRAAVITTPNWEYNVVLRQIGAGAAGPPGRDGTPLRNSDHKFEWTRHDFQSWAVELADAYGYDVKFTDVGHALKEEEIISADGWKGPKDVGGASQAAIFRRQERGNQGGLGGLSFRVWGPRRLTVPLGEGEMEAKAEDGQQADVDTVEHF